MSLVLILNTIPSFAQNQDFDRMKQRMQLREEAHRRMREKILKGRGGDDLFDDLEKMFNDMMNDTSTSFEPRDDFAVSSNSFSTEWVSDGKTKTLILTPKDKSVELDINVKDQVITIGSKQKSKDQNSYSESSSTSIFPVPIECDGGKVQMKSVDNSIHLVFPLRVQKNGDQNDRQPLKPSSGDVEI